MQERMNQLMKIMEDSILEATPLYMKDSEDPKLEILHEAHSNALLEYLKLDKEIRPEFFYEALQNIKRATDPRRQD